MLNNENVQKLLSKTKYNFNDLCLILEILRGEGGCPWDAEQTHQSIRKNFIEETYEVLEAIDNNDTALLREELGDVMLQVVFHTQMEKELGNFDIDDVSNDVCAKLIHRHPHIFGNVQAGTSEEVLNNWEAIKNEEKKRETLYDRLNSVPPMTPALMRASKVAKKSEKFNEVTAHHMLNDISNKLETAENSSTALTEEALGELLFTISALSFKYNLDPEEALFKYTNSFIESFREK